MDLPLTGMGLFPGYGEWEPAGICTGWVACSEDVPMAVSLACRRSGELLALTVLPEFQGKGIGCELLRQAEAWLFSHGWETISASPMAASAVPVDFLLRRGWQAGGPEGRGRLSKTSGKPAFSLEEHWIEDSDFGDGRLIRLSRGPADRTHPLCLILDGEAYWRDLAAAPLFGSVADSIPSGMACAYVGHVSAVDRHRDFTANERYARFIGERVIPWLQQEVAGLAEGGHVVVGLSLSGLMAVHLALRYPRLFCSCVSQSGSHWWDPEGFAEAVKHRAPIQGRFWLSVGAQETATDVRHPPTGLHQKISQVEGARHAARVLGESGGLVRYHEFEGGHSAECWRQELEEAIRWCLPSKTRRAI